MQSCFIENMLLASNQPRAKRHFFPDEPQADYSSINLDVFNPNDFYSTHLMSERGHQRLDVSDFTPRYKRLRSQAEDDQAGEGSYGPTPNYVQSIPNTACEYTTPEDQANEILSSVPVASIIKHVSSNHPFMSSNAGTLRSSATFSSIPGRFAHRDPPRRRGTVPRIASRSSQTFSSGPLNTSFCVENEGKDTHTVLISDSGVSSPVATTDGLRSRDDFSHSSENSWDFIDAELQEYPTQSYGDASIFGNMGLDFDSGLFTDSVNSPPWVPGNYGNIDTNFSDTTIPRTFSDIDLTSTDLSIGLQLSQADSFPTDSKRDQINFGDDWGISRIPSIIDHDTVPGRSSARFLQTTNENLAYEPQFDFCTDGQTRNCEFTTRNSTGGEDIFNDNPMSRKCKIVLT